MMQCVRRCSFICGAVLSILLLLCSCQAGAGPLILPDNVPSKNASQGKEKLLAALNTIVIRRPETTQDSYIPGADSVAETIFLCIQKKSGNNAAAAIKLLSANEVTGFANCADIVLNSLSTSPDETYLVSYALSAPMFWKMVLCGEMPTSVVSPSPSSPIGVFLFTLRVFRAPPARRPAFPSASSAIRRSLWLCSFPDSIFQDKQKMTAAVSCSAAVISLSTLLGKPFYTLIIKDPVNRKKKLLFVDLRGLTL